MGDFAFRLKRVDATDPAVWARIVAMDAKCFVKAEAPALADNQGAWWIAYTGDQEAGYCGIKQFATGDGYLCRSGVLPKFRGCGLQKIMIRRRVAYARSLGWKAVTSDTASNPQSGNSLIACGFRLYEPERKWALESSIYWRKFLTGSPK
jgi:ribosomal protein S18 acetylase RimI-like enzyme